MDVDRLLLVLTMKKNFLYILLRLNFFEVSKPKVVYLRPFYFSNIPEISETTFYVLWTQTCRNLKSIIFANFLSITYLNEG